MVDKVEQGEQEPAVEVVERLEFSEFPPGTQFLIGLQRGAFHARLVDPETGKAVVRFWLGGGQRNAGTGDVMSTIGTRPFEEGRPPADLTSDKAVAWGGLTFGDEFVLRNEETGGNLFFTGQPVEQCKYKM